MRGSDAKPPAGVSAAMGEERRDPPCVCAAARRDVVVLRLLAPPSAGRPPERSSGGVRAGARGRRGSADGAGVLEVVPASGERVVIREGASSDLVRAVVAALRHGRRFVGIELNAVYLSLARARIEEESCAPSGGLPESPGRCRHLQPPFAVSGKP